MTTLQIPDLVIHDSIAVFEVATALLDPQKFERSDDHVQAFFPADLESFIYADSIGPEHIVRLLSLEVAR